MRVLVRYSGGQEQLDEVKEELRRRAEVVCSWWQQQQQLQRLQRQQQQHRYTDEESSWGCSGGQDQVDELKEELRWWAELVCTQWQQVRRGVCSMCACTHTHTHTHTQYYELRIERDRI